MIGDLPNIVGGLGHLVGCCVGSPVDIVQEACLDTVTDCIYRLILKAGCELYVVTGNGDSVCFGVDSYGEVACTGNSELNVVAVSVADPSRTVLDDLKTYGLIRFFSGEGLGIGAVSVLCHLVAGIAAVPECIKQGVGRAGRAFCVTSYDIDVFCHRIVAVTGRGNRLFEQIDNTERGCTGCVCADDHRGHQHYG